MKTSSIPACLFCYTSYPILLTLHGLRLLDSWGPHHLRYCDGLAHDTPVLGFDSPWEWISGWLKNLPCWCQPRLWCGAIGPALSGFWGLSVGWRLCFFFQPILWGLSFPPIDSFLYFQTEMQSLCYSYQNPKWVFIQKWVQSNGYIDKRERRRYKTVLPPSQIKIPFR